MFPAYFLGGPWHGQTHALQRPVDPFRVAGLADEPIQWDPRLTNNPDARVAIREERYRLDKVRLFGRSLRVYVHESIPPGSPRLDALAFDAFVSPLARGLIESQEAGR